ncbi:DUF6578 domain-containing protein [Phytohabitans aurantiacus]|uniref:DUF6578 domain-containing protein n=1 Tax=Phytohabitans aurantiacus TaxID=3016789 RepID=UPI0024937197|nr:DUF6578 domain-containing protein [Phytohabitans aurantiacus]
MEITVWIAAWQMQCCGDPFRPGERVAWTVLRGARTVLGGARTVLGDQAVTVDAVEEHHQEDDSQVEPVIGTVASIRAVSRSGVTTDVELADGWTESPSGTGLMGYLVELTGAARGDEAARASR